MPRKARGSRLSRPIEPIRLPSPEILRIWGKEHGWDISNRGRIPSELEKEYLRYRYQAQRRLKTLRK